MGCKNYFFLILVSINYFSAPCQCPLSNSAWKRIKFLADKDISVDRQLSQLLNIKIEFTSCQTTEDSTYAFLLQRIGVMYYRKNDFSSSVKFTQYALDILYHLQKKININPSQIIQCYQNLSYYYDALGLFGKKNEAIDSCISIGLASKQMNELLLESIYHKISYLMNLGDYQRTIDYANLAQTIAEKNGFNNADIVATILGWKINALLLLKDYSEVENELKNKIREYGRSHSEDFIGNLFELRAKYFLEIGESDSAIISYKKSFQYFKNAIFNSGCASSLNSIGFVYFEKYQDYSKALSYYFGAMHYADKNEAISILTNIGNVHDRINNFDSAFYYYQRAFDQIGFGMNENSLLKTRNFQAFRSLAEYLVTLVLDKADARLDQYKLTRDKEQLDQTLLSFKTADKIMDKIKENQFELQSKLSWRKNTRRLYEHAIEACLLAKNNEDGLYFFEKSRAVLLDDQLKSEFLMQNHDLLEQFQLKTDINRLEDKLDTISQNSNLYAGTQTEIIQKKEEQDRLLTTIREKDPLYYARNLNVDSMSIMDIQKTVLKDHSAIVEIFNGDNSVFTLTITNDNSWISKIDDHSFDSLSEQFTSYLSNASMINNHFPQFTTVSRKLYELIFQNHTLPKGRIIISPDGAFFPFEALITNKGSDIDYMLNDYSISYTYSARYLMSRFENITDRKVNDFMGIAPVNYASYLNLPSLPGSDISINQIQSHFSKVSTPMNSAASKSNFLYNFSNYKIVQLYSHASYSDSSGKPVIYFADSSMNLSELFARERPAARLVVLSACETALGTDYKGEGVFSFSREFAGLGIPASVSNLWSVDNESTYRITELFYEFLSKGEPTDIALQKAKLTFIKESTLDKRLPFYWAPSILLGKTEVIKTRAEFPYRLIFLILGILGALIWIIIRTKSSR